ncbi:DNA polymerase III subunit gamma/tau [Thermophilibacter provencensis]|uniref:DNA polymerase III subunit gamma/tau n=1 Tax=Thermophilibacter provencensis TaxID=1852386 RepID=UPI0023A81DC9|nr:DNA polymerase III subunit gamma/tau [Thermophilibacter provencensis]
MESLYTKYRPQTFEQVVGQSHVVETLKRAVLEGRTSHAYLFCGPRGTGKTTMARILAKALMCERGPAALPDGTCEQCQLIASGEHPDVIELDAASRTGVDNVREEIISRVSYAPTRGRCKVYIIDEVHMLTTAAFNALLKTLEEPPEHVVFIMCTTDPQKILATILSRVQRFDFHAIGNEEMQAHLAFVCGQEGFAYDERALELIVRHARGGMRDALTTLEQLSVFGAGEISLAAASDFLGEVSGSVLGQVSRAMAHRDVAVLFSEVASLAEAGRDLLQFTRELAAHVRDVYVVSVVPSADDVVEARGEELDSLRGEAAAFGAPDRLSRVLTILGEASSEMRTAPNQRLVLEIAFTRIARPDSDLTLESLAERVADLERQVAILAAPRGEKNLDPRPAVPATPQPAAPSHPQPQTEAVPEPTAERSSAPVAAPAPERPTTSRPAEALDVAAGPAAPSPSASRVASEERSDERRAAGRGRGGAGGGVTNGNLQRLWKQVVDQLVAQVPAKGSLLLSSTAVSDDGEKLMVSLPKGSHFAARMLERADVRESVDPVIAATFGPRQVVYVESSLASQAISRSERPAPVPGHRPQPAPQPAPAPTPVSPAPSAPAPEPMTPAPETAAPDYPMPWDAPTSAPAVQPAPAPAQAVQPAPAPTAEQVPYSDADLVAYEESYEHEVSFSTPAPASAPAPAAPAPDATREASEPQGGERGAGGSDVGAVGGGAELTPEFADIASMLAEAFGQPLEVSVEPAVTTSDEDAAAELAYDGDPVSGDGFTAEPEEDGDEDDD